MPKNSLIAAIADQPLLVAPDAGTRFSATLQELAADPRFMACYDRAPVAQEDDYWDESDPFVAAFRPYVVTNGVLQIPVQGVLLHKFSFQFGRRATGYQYIERAFTRGMADPAVQAIAFLIDSPGGEVAGNFELVEKMAARRDTKPMRAFAADFAFSAAYSIATASSQITMARSGGVGSVGVVVAHVEMSEALKDRGVTVTLIHAGKHKVDGNPYQALSEDARNRIQARVDRIYGEFTALVATNRGMDEKAVRATEALTYDISEAIEVGFADRIGSFEEEMAVFAREAETEEDELMTAKTTTEPEKVYTAAEMAESNQVAHLAGQAAERARISAILGSDAGKAHPKAAMAAALKTAMTADEALALLDDLPPEQTSKPNGFRAAMESTGNPEVGAEVAEVSEAPNSNAILGAFSVATGKPRKRATA